MTISLDFPAEYAESIIRGEKTVSHQFFDQLNIGDLTTVSAGSVKRKVRIKDKTWLPKEDIDPKTLEEILKTIPEDENFDGVYRFEFDYVDATPMETAERSNVSPGREHGERYFGPKTRLDWNRINEDDVRYPVRFPPGWDQQQKKRPDDGWPPSSFYTDFFYWMETPKYQNAALKVARRYFKRLADAINYFGQGNFGELGTKLIRPIMPGSRGILKDYTRYWLNEPWRRVFRYEDLTEDESRNDLQFELFELNRDLHETPDLYQKWVDHREVREDRPNESLPSGPPVEKFWRKRKFSSSSLILRALELIVDNDCALKKSWTIDELVKQTIQRNRVLSKDCTAKFVRSDLKKLVWTYKVTCSGGDPAGHLCRIKILSEYKGVSQKPEDILDIDFNKLHVGVKCTCPAFQYWGPSFNSWAQGYYYGPREDSGSSPRKNVRHKLPLDGLVRRALLCKHLITAAADWADRVLTEESL